MSLSSTEAQSDSSFAVIARSFVAARREARALPGYPGEVPRTLDEAYAVQDAAIRLWDRPIAGWKVGRIAPPLDQRFGADRLAGPIFQGLVWMGWAGQIVEVPVFEGGFAAVEAEYVFRLGRDAPPGGTEWSRDDAAQLVEAMHIGVETAGSPLATINELGPPVIVSDFGNNHGLILGPEIADWRERDLGSFTCETFIDGVSVGRGAASNLPGGPLQALCFLLENTTRRGRRLRAGQLVSTGAATGVHDISVGQTARVSFGNDGEILCRAVKA